ncbi:MAG: hypothetical protein IT195_02850 [Microthrixaceae bacterium]|nr:hypothetical protein [Microthrixaceae bacterium]
MQVVTLSSRPDVLAETLTHLRHFLPWIDDVVVIAPEAQRASFEKLVDSTVVSDEEISGLSTAELRGLDHMSRNFTLRGGLGRHDAVADQFLMADDDHRPLKAVDPSFFIDGEGRHRGYFFYDLDEWPGTSTPFDDGQHHARELLGYLGYDRLAYGSHMPQMIRKEFLAEVWDLVARLTDTKSLCEWTMYFNAAQARHPDAFCDPEPFRTLAWPQYPNEWPWWVRPPEYVFENFYPELYEAGRLFDGLPTALETERTERVNVEKILRWSTLGRRIANLDFPDDIANPWTQDSRARRGAFKVLRRMRQAYGYLSMEDSARLTELSGSVRRLEDEIRRLRADRSS